MIQFRDSPFTRIHPGCWVVFRGVNLFYVESWYTHLAGERARHKNKETKKQTKRPVFVKVRIADDGSVRKNTWKTGRYFFISSSLVFYFSNLFVLFLLLLLLIFLSLRTSTSFCVSCPLCVVFVTSALYFSLQLLVLGVRTYLLSASEASLDSKQWSSEEANLISDSVDRERYTWRELFTSWCV